MSKKNSEIHAIQTFSYYKKDRKLKCRSHTYLMNYMCTFNKIQLVLNKYSRDMAVLEALYVFLKSWYTYASTNFEMILPCGGKWIPLDDIVIMQLSLRGLEAESLFNEFKQVLQAFNISRSETETLINTIEASYSKELENLLRKRLSKLSESESELLEFFASYYFYVEEERNYLYYSIFDKLKNILGEDANKLYNILVGKGLVIIHGYRSITDKRVIDHIGVYVPPWSRKYLKEKFDKYLAKQELKSKEIIQKLDEAEQDIKEGRIRKWEEFIKEIESKT